MNSIIKFSDYILEEEMSRKERRLQRREERLEKKLDKIGKKRGGDSPVLGDQEESQKRLSTPFYQIKGKELPMEQKIDINGQSVEPYGIANNVMNTWIEEVKTETLDNIDSKYKVAIKALIERSLNKIFPIVSKYFIPSVKFDGKPIIEETKIEPKEFWLQVWPQIWKEMNAVERGIVKSMTSLREETTYDQLIEMVGKALSDEKFSGYNEVVSEQLSNLLELFGLAFSTTFKDKAVEVSQEMMGKLVTDLNAKGAKINFKSSQKSKGGQQELENVDLGKSSKEVWAETIVKQIEEFRKLLTSEEDNKGEKDQKYKEEEEVKDIKFPSSIKTKEDLKKWASSLSSDQKQVLLGALGFSEVKKEDSEGKDSGGSGSVQSAGSGGKEVLKRGMKSEEVGKLQDALGMTNLGTQRTNFGSKTEQAVKEFQRKKGLVDDGIVGPKTREKLGI